MQSSQMMMNAQAKPHVFGSSCRRDLVKLRLSATNINKVTRTTKNNKQAKPILAAQQQTAEVAPFRAWDDAKNSKKRTDLKKIMILGAGPIVIGQVCNSLLLLMCRSLALSLLNKYY